MFWKKKTILLTLVLVFALAAASLALSDSWTSKTDMPTARRNMGAAVLNGKIYVIGGNPPQTGGFKTVEEYDPATDTWTTKVPMQMSRGGLGVSVVNGKIYVIGGMTYPNSSFNRVDEYDPTTDTWTTKAPMPTRRFGLSTCAVNGKIYAIGGQGSWPNVTRKVEEYDPATDTWTTKSNMPTARAHLSTSVVNGKIYAIGGVLEYPEITSRVEEYDPVTNSWTRKADMPTARTFLITCVLNGRIYAIGGAGPDPDGPPIPTVEEYNPSTDTWITKADLPTARGHLAACTVNGRIYAIGGTTGGFPWPVVSTVEEYDPGLPPPDFNGDQKIDIEDLLLLIEYWGQDEPAIDFAPPLGDGIVDTQDLELLMSYWQQEPDDPTLIAHWALDEAEGIMAQDKAGGNDAYIIGDPLWQPAGGIVDGAIQLDGVDDCAVTGPIPDFSAGPLSVISWIKGGAPSQVILSQMGVSNWLCTDPSGGTLMTELKSPGQDGISLESEVAITDGDWHRLGLVWDGFYRTLYVDGVAVAGDIQNGMESSENGLYIGVGKTMQSGTYFSGLIDDVRIYNRVVIP
jgi:N-acetylneuraminic acid mutarotase